jgi:hypothetical protein
VTGHGWAILGIIVLPFIGFTAWLFGQFLSARREETDAVMRKGLLAEAVVVGYAAERRGATLQYRFVASGRENPITVSARVTGKRKFVVGERIAIRYLPGHPHISVVLPAK